MSPDDLAPRRIGWTIIFLVVPFLCFFPFVVLQEYRNWFSLNTRVATLVYPSILLYLLIQRSSLQWAEYRYEQRIATSVSLIGFSLAVLGGLLCYLPLYLFAGHLCLLGWLFLRCRGVGFSKSFWLVVLLTMACCWPKTLIDSIASATKLSAAWLAHTSLEGVSIPNVLQRMEIESSDQKYQVLDRLHGLDSCLAFMLLAGSLTLFFRRSLLHFCLLLAASITSVVLGHWLYVMCAFLLREQLNFDLTSDVEFYLVGLGCWVLQVGFVFASDQLLMNLLQPVPTDLLRNEYSRIAPLLNSVFVWPNSQFVDYSHVEDPEEPVGVEGDVVDDGEVNGSEDGLIEEEVVEEADWQFGRYYKLAAATVCILSIISMLFLVVVWKESNQSQVVSRSIELLQRWEAVKFPFALEAGDSVVEIKEELSEDDVGNEVRRHWKCDLQGQEVDILIEYPVTQSQLWRYELDKHEWVETQRLFSGSSRIRDAAFDRPSLWMMLHGEGEVNGHVYVWVFGFDEQNQLVPTGQDFDLFSKVASRLRRNVVSLLIGTGTESSATRFSVSIQASDPIGPERMKDLNEWSERLANSIIENVVSANELVMPKLP